MLARPFVLAAALLALPLAAHGDGYVLIERDGRVVKWGDPNPGRGATVTYAVAQTDQRDRTRINCQHITGIGALLAQADVPRSAFDADLRAALAMWARVSDLRFRRVAKAADADLVVGAQAAPRGIAYTSIQHTSGPASATAARLTRATICLNPDAPWQARPDGKNTTYDFHRVLAHEIGHAIGLDHPGRDGPVMAYRYRETLDRLQPGDIAGAQALYGTTGTTPAVARRDRTAQR